MFNPKYQITPKLLRNLKDIVLITQKLNGKHFPNVVKIELKTDAKALSSHSSTSIEGNPLGLTQVKAILKNRPGNLRDSEKEVLNYNQALTYLSQKKDLSNVTLQTILDIHSLVVNDLLPKNQTGKLRTLPVFVNNPVSNNVIYLPPDDKNVPQLIRELLQFVNASNDTDPLIVAGIFHKQMVIIHPFMDGNGRTTRLATKLILAKMGLDTFDLFSFENYYNKNVTKYFQNVGAYGNYYDIASNIDFTHWLEYFTDGIIDELTRVETILIEKSTTQPTHPYLQKAINYLKSKNQITVSQYMKLTGRAKSTASKDLDILVKEKILVRKGKGKNIFYTLT